MPRNSSGNYTLPAGNPVVTGTTITSTWANTTMQDIGSEVTNSLDRQGRGSMLAAFKLVDGSVAVPGLSFGSETTTGISRPTAGRFSISVLAAEVLAAITTGVAVTGNLAVSGALTLGGAFAAPLGAVTTPSFTFVGDLDTGMWSPGADTLAWSTNGVERARFSSVGVFTIAPATVGRTLNVSGAAAGTTLDNWLENTSNTAGSNTRFIVGVGGATANDPSLVFDVAGVTSWAVGIDNSDGDKFKISRGIALGTTDVVSIDTTGSISVSAPVSGSTLTLGQVVGGRAFDVVASLSGAQVRGVISNTSNTASSDATHIVSVAGAAAGDPSIIYDVSGATNWIHGIDNSDSDKFKLSFGATLGTGDVFEITTSGEFRYLKDGTAGQLAEVGFRGLPYRATSGADSAVNTDRGRGVALNAAGNFTIPSGVFNTGDVLPIHNAVNAAQTIVQGAGLTLRFGTSQAAGGNRTIAINGTANILFLSGSVATISGSGVT
jgi:hypothetical protein